jgi:hypothetical protein
MGMKHEYCEGPEARQKFDEGMTKLFRAPKTVVVKETPAPPRKKAKVSKD